MVRVPLVVLEPASGGTQRSLSPYVLTIWWNLERQLLSAEVLGVKMFRTTVVPSENIFFMQTDSYVKDVERKSLPVS